MLKNKYLSLDRREVEVNTKWARETQCDSNHPDVQLIKEGRRGRDSILSRFPRMRPEGPLPTGTVE